MTPDQRRTKALRLAAKGLTVRQIGTELGCSHVTIVRDLRVARAAEAEAIMATLAALGTKRDKAKPQRRPKRASQQEIAEAQRGDPMRRLRAITAVYGRGWGIRETARQLGLSPATVSRYARLARAPIGSPDGYAAWRVVEERAERWRARRVLAGKSPW